MYLNNRSDNFKVELPRTFIPDHIKAKWKPYLLRMPTPIEDITDFVNYTIVSISVPPNSYEPVAQQHTKADKREADSRGFSRNWRSATNRKELVEKQFTISFKQIDGYLNYWILQEVFWYWYDKDNRDPYMPSVPIRLFDTDGVVMFTAMYTDCLFTGLSEFELSYANNLREYKSFDCTFTFNELKTELPTQ